MPVVARRECGFQTVHCGSDQQQTTVLSPSLFCLDLTFAWNSLVSDLCAGRSSDILPN